MRQSASDACATKIRQWSLAILRIILLYMKSKAEKEVQILMSPRNLRKIMRINASGLSLRELVRITLVVSLDSLTLTSVTTSVSSTHLVGMC